MTAPLTAPSPFAGAVGRVVELARRTWLSLFTQFAVIAVRLVGLRLLTQLVGLDAYGQVTLVLQAVALGSSTVLNALGQAGLRFYPEALAQRWLGALRRELVTLITYAVAIAGAVALAASVVVAVLPAHSRSIGTSVLFALAGAAIFGLEGARALRLSWTNAAGNHGSYFRQSLGDTAFRIAGGIAGALLVRGSALATLVGTAIGGLVALLVFKAPVVHQETDPAAAEHIAALRRSIWTFALPLVPAAVLGWFVGSGDRFFLALRGGLGETGLYAAGYGLASQPLLALSMGCVLAFRPRLYDAVAAGDMGRLRRQVGEWILVYGLAALAGVLALSVAADWAAGIALAPAFRGAAAVIPIVGIAHALQGLQFVFETVLYAQKRTRWLLVLQIIGGGVAVVLYWVLIPSMGARGAAIGTAGAYAASLLAAVVLALPALRRAR